MVLFSILGVALLVVFAIIAFVDLRVGLGVVVMIFGAVVGESLLRQGSAFFGWLVTLGSYLGAIAYMAWPLITGRECGGFGGSPWSSGRPIRRSLPARD